MLKVLGGSSITHLNHCGYAVLSLVACWLLLLLSARQ